MRIFPGPVNDQGLLAAPWTPAAAFAGPDGLVRREFVWAAFDCPQLWAEISVAGAELMKRFATAKPTFVTGQMVTELRRPVPAKEPHVILAWPIESEGRKRYAGGALLDAEGDPLATSRQTIFVLSD